MNIQIEKLYSPKSAPGTISVRPVLPGEIPDVATDCVSIVGPAHYDDPASPGDEVVWLFASGHGTIQTKDRSCAVSKATIARAPLGWSWTIDVPSGATLLAMRIRKPLSADDRAELQKSDYLKNNAASYIKTFEECIPYSEAIKSAKTVSRTLLPENFVPRMAIGTVETTGPDQVGRHQHPMLEQLFLGLEGNDATVSADEARIPFPALSVLHIPLGSMHGTQVAAGKKLYYVWMDFFTTKEGQAWLKMHKPVKEMLLNQKGP